VDDDVVKADLEEGRPHKAPCPLPSPECVHAALLLNKGFCINLLDMALHVPHQRGPTCFWQLSGDRTSHRGWTRDNDTALAASHHARQHQVNLERTDVLEQTGALEDSIEQGIVPS
jgi:hypothetical protein